MFCFTEMLHLPHL